MFASAQPRLCDLGEGLARVCEDGVLAGERLPTPNCNVHVERIEFEAVAEPTDTFRGEYGRA
jgi:hypothetical protein